MTESDKSYISAEFAALRLLMCTYKESNDEKMKGTEKWICNVEKKTDVNSRYINFIIGALIFAGAILGAIEISIK